MNSSEQEAGDAPTSTPPAATDADVTYVSAPDPAPLVGPERDAAPSRPRRRRIRLPVILFLLTCASTFLAGATNFAPDRHFFHAIGIHPDTFAMQQPTLMPLRESIYQHWRVGLVYMSCVLGILLAHEMGHFVLTLVHRVRASWPFFIPLPISPIGTMGAVIAMDGRQANRREIFDIGIAGPLAGLVVALPIMWIGVHYVDLGPSRGPNLQVPLAMRLALEYTRPGEYDPSVGFALTRANPYFMAGWVGLLVTGLNMLPVSQLDGGHVTYALFGRRAHWLARAFMGVALVYIAIVSVVDRTAPPWIVMVALVLLIGTDHPPTKDDSVPLGPVRVALGYASLLIPIFCFVPNLQV
jgi:Zn-dependent protease